MEFAVAKEEAKSQGQKVKNELLVELIEEAKIKLGITGKFKVPR